MKKIYLFALILTLFICISETNAQVENPSVNQTNPPQQNLWQNLELSPDQIRQIRQINQANRPLLNQAKRRQVEAARLLDEAVYAETVNENLVAERLKNLQIAHSEFYRVKTDMELAFRKVLTSEQLLKFQELREQAMRRKQNLNRQDDRRMMPQKPLRLPQKRLPVNRQ